MKAMLLLSKELPSPDDIKSLKSLFCGLFDWQIFFGFLKYHRLSVPVYVNLKKYLKEFIPEEIFVSIETLHRRNLYKSLSNVKAAIKISSLLNSKRINHIFLKGLCLSKILYGQPGYRYTGDIDLIIHQSQLDRVIKLFDEFGYKNISPTATLRPDELNIFLSLNHHLSFICPDTNVRIELHYQFYKIRGLFPLHFNEVWKRKRYVRIAGYDFPFADHEHTLIILMMHGCHHLWFRLFWLKDVVDLFLKGITPFDERGFFDYMSKIGYSRPAAFMLHLNSELYGSDKPECVVNYIRKDWFFLLIMRMIDFSLMNPDSRLTVFIVYFSRMYMLKNNLYKKSFLSYFFFARYHKKVMRKMESMKDDGLPKVRNVLSASE